MRQRILVVDSDHEAAGRFAEVIAGFYKGYEVSRAFSGFEGVQKIEKAFNTFVCAHCCSGEEVDYQVAQ